MHKHIQKSVMAFVLTGLLLGGCTVDSDDAVEPGKSVESHGTVVTAESASTVETGESEECVLVPPKQPLACTMQYDPVCGEMTEGRSKTFSNACVACSDRLVAGYLMGSCGTQGSPDVTR
mgnify:CR=1 FL=1